VARVLMVLAHGDADGVSSAAVVKAALAGEYEVVWVYFTHPVDLAKDFEAFAEGDVYVVDVAIDEKTAAGARMPKHLLKTDVEELNRLAGGP
jgi:single-stranded-DNA-specific exonuclease